jgi:hypothetical protein
LGGRRVVEQLGVIESVGDPSLILLDLPAERRSSIRARRHRSSAAVSATETNGDSHARGAQAISLAHRGADLLPRG